MGNYRFLFSCHSGLLFSNAKDRKIRKSSQNDDALSFENGNISPEQNLNKNSLKKILNEVKIIEWPSFQSALETPLLVIAVIVVSSCLLSGVNLILTQVALKVFG